MNKTRRRAASALLALIAVAAPVGAVVSPLAQAGSMSAHVVVLKGLRFHPSTITIHRGESVTWEWRDGGIAHNVTAKSFHSRTQSHGSFTVRFTHTGTFNYHCTIHVHLGMVGKVVVR